MTEITANTDSRINLPAFIGALVLAPLVVGLSTFILIIPLFAIGFGFLGYVTCGGPIYVALLAAGNHDRMSFFLGGLLANIPSAYLCASVIHEPDQWPLYFFMGLIFAPAWSLAFRSLYLWFCRTGA